MASQVFPPRDGFWIKTFARQFTGDIMEAFRRHIKKTEGDGEGSTLNACDGAQPLWARRAMDDQ
jgi:hypothetical protein